MKHTGNLSSKNLLHLFAPVLSQEHVVHWLPFAVDMWFISVSRFIYRLDCLNCFTLYIVILGPFIACCSV